MERWGADALPTPPARIAQARAFIQLGLMDRAWSRLRDLVESGESGLMPFVLAARMFLLRGWDAQARKTIKRAMALELDSDELQVLWGRATNPTTKPDLAIIDDEQADGQALLAAATHLMAAGSFLKARKVLERLKRRDAQDKRVLDLLWAMGGDFAIGGGSLAELADRHGPPLQLLADFGDDDDPEHTAELRLDGPTVEPPEDSSSFPNLFRNLEPQTEMWGDTGEREVTQVAAMADLEAMRVHETLPEQTGGGKEDTQIVRVMRRESLTKGGPRPAEPPAAPRSSFDLGVLGGRQAPPRGGDLSDLEDLGPDFEAEDDDLIVRTRREVTEVTEQNTEVSSRIKLSDENLDSGGTVDEAAEWVRSAAQGQALGEGTSSSSAKTVPPKARRKRRKRAPSLPWWVGALILVLLFGAGAVMLLIVYQVASLLMG